MAYKCIQKEQKFYHTHNLHYRTYVLYIKVGLQRNKKTTIGSWAENHALIKQQMMVP